MENELNLINYNNQEIQENQKKISIEFIDQDSKKISLEQIIENTFKKYKETSNDLLAPNFFLYGQCNINTNYYRINFKYNNEEQNLAGGKDASVNIRLYNKIFQQVFSKIDEAIKRNDVENLPTINEIIAMFSKIFKIDNFKTRWQSPFCFQSGQQNTKLQMKLEPLENSKLCHFFFNLLQKNFYINTIKTLNESEIITLLILHDTILVWDNQNKQYNKNFEEIFRKQIKKNYKGQNEKIKDLFNLLWTYTKSENSIPNIKLGSLFSDQLIFSRVFKDLLSILPKNFGQEDFLRSITPLFNTQHLFLFYSCSEPNNDQVNLIHSPLSSIAQEIFILCKKALVNKKIPKEIPVLTEDEMKTLLVLMRCKIDPETDKSFKEIAYHYFMAQKDLANTLQKYFAAGDFNEKTAKEEFDLLPMKKEMGLFALKVVCAAIVASNLSNEEKLKKLDQILETVFKCNHFFLLSRTEAGNGIVKYKEFSEATNTFYKANKIILKSVLLIWHETNLKEENLFSKINVESFLQNFLHIKKLSKELDFAILFNGLQSKNKFFDSNQFWQTEKNGEQSFNHFLKKEVKRYLRGGQTDQDYLLQKLSLISIEKGLFPWMAAECKKALIKVGFPQPMPSLNPTESSRLCILLSAKTDKEIDHAFSKIAYAYLLQQDLKMILFYQHQIFEIEEYYSMFKSDDNLHESTCINSPLIFVKSQNDKLQITFYKPNDNKFGSNLDSMGCHETNSQETKKLKILFNGEDTILSKDEKFSEAFSLCGYTNWSWDRVFKKDFNVLAAKKKEAVIAFRITCMQTAYSKKLSYEDKFKKLIELQTILYQEKNGEKHFLLLSSSKGGVFHEYKDKSNNFDKANALIQNFILLIWHEMNLKGEKTQIANETLEALKKIGKKIPENKKQPGWTLFYDFCFSPQNKQKNEDKDISYEKQEEHICPCWSKPITTDQAKKVNNISTVKDDNLASFKQFLAMLVEKHTLLNPANEEKAAEAICMTLLNIFESISKPESEKIDGPWGNVFAIERAGKGYFAKPVGLKKDTQSEKDVLILFGQYFGKYYNKLSEETMKTVNDTINKNTRLKKLSLQLPNQNNEISKNILN